MKKLVLSAVLGASLMISSSAFALTAMSDANMKAATGQAGVSIAIDNVVIEQYVGSTTYTDESGTDGTAGSVVISDKHTVKTFLALTSATDFATDFAAAANNEAALGNWTKASALSIDVGTCGVLTAGLIDNATNVVAAGANAAEMLADLMSQGMTQDEAMAILGAKQIAGGGGDIVVTGVVIGLPTLLISTTADQYSVGVAKAGAINDGKDFITISKGASAMAILGGTVEIAAH